MDVIVSNTAPIAVEVVNNPSWGQAFLIAVVTGGLAGLVSGGILLCRDRWSRIRDRDRDLIQQIAATLDNLLPIRDAQKHQAKEYVIKERDAFMQLRGYAYRLCCRSNRQFKQGVLDFVEEGPGRTRMSARIKELRSKAEKLLGEELPPFRDS